MNGIGMVAVVAFAATAFGAEVAPQHEWTFESLDAEGRVALDTGAAKEKYKLYGRTALGRGTDVSTALVSDGRTKNQLPHAPMDYSTFTVDFAFRPAELPAANKRAFLFDYQCWSWGRNRWSVALEGNGALTFFAEKKGEISFKAVSDPVKLSIGHYHTLRFQVAEDGLFTAWLDGAEIARQAGAPGFDKLMRKPADKYYPLLRMGVDDTDPNAIRSPFIGDFDDIRVYDVALGAAAVRLPSYDYSKIAKVEYKPADAGGADVLVLNDTGFARTRRFTVMDHEGSALGLMETADKKFVDAAATVDLTVGDKTVVARFVCPVPKGMTVVKSTRNAWAGDGVELFIRPDVTKSVYCQYSANAAGKSNFMRCLAPDVVDSAFTSKASVAVADTAEGFEIVFTVPTDELFPAGLKAGDVFGANFVRCGKTCSGASTWAAVGGKFSNIEGFGKVVYGGSAAYFANRLAALKSQVDRFPEASRKAADETCRPVAEAVKAHGANPEAFVALETMFVNADRALLQIQLAGMPLVIYEAKDVWGSLIAPDSSTRPLESVKVKLPKNGKAVYGFTVANLRDHPFLGQIKCCSAMPGKSFWCVPQNGIASRATFYRGFPIWNRAGKELYDPVEPLSMKTIVRLAPKEFAPMYIELDAKGLQSGVYNTLVYLKEATPGYEDLKFALEVEVTDLDVAGVKLDKAGYDYAGRSFAERKEAKGDLVKFLCARDYNTAFVAAMRFSPKADKEGKFAMRSYEAFDRQIEEYLKYVAREDLKLWIYMVAEKHWYDPCDYRGERFPFGSEKWAEGVRFMVKNVKEHVKSKYGIGPDRIWWYTVDEPSGPIVDPTWKSKIAIAYRLAQEIKRESPENLTMTDPLPNFLASKDIDEALTKFRECYDIIELYRPGITDKTKALMERLKFPQVWTYSIVTKETPAANYRRDYWMNMRDGYREIATYWHMTQAAGGDAFDSSDWNSPGHLDDYATLYSNADVEDSILSRRQLQCDQGFWDMQIIAALRAKYAGNAEKLAAIAEIIREAADIGTVRAMDDARNRLLGL